MVKGKTNIVKLKELERSVELYKMLHAIANIETFKNDLDTIFEKTLYILKGQGVFDIEKAGLSIIDERSRTAIIRAVKPLKNPVFDEGFRIPLYGSSIGFSVGSRSPIIKPLVTKHTTFEETYLINASIKSYVVIPIYINDKAIATLNLSSSKENSFTSGDRQFFTLLSRQLSSLAKHISELQAIRSDFEHVKSENVYLHDELTREHSYYELVGKNAGFVNAIEKGRSLAQNDSPVLIHGENGTGKESLARLIHSMSPRKVRAFIKFDCKSTSPSLIDLELFGGAKNSKAGKIRVAGSSTLFINSLELVPLDVQKRLMDEIAAGKVRFIFSTSVDPQILLSNRYLSRELYDGIGPDSNVIYMPSVRERKDDIEEFVRYFVSKFSRKYGKSINSISDEVIRSFMSYDWPGNVSELGSVVSEAVQRSRDRFLGMDDVRFSPEHVAVDEDITYERIKEVVKNVERDILKKVLEKTDGRIYGEDGAAKLLGVKPTTLQSRLKALEIP